VIQISANYEGENKERKDFESSAGAEEGTLNPLQISDLKSAPESAKTGLVHF
jgi:hypothetical protein